MLHALLSLGIWTVTACLTVLLWVGSLCTVILTGWWDPHRRITHYWARAWSWAMVQMNPFWQLTVHDEAHLNRTRPYIFVSNHQSFADVVLLPFIKVPYKCFAKSSLFRLPFFGWSLALHRHIRLRRDSLHSMHDAMEEARQWLQRGMSVAFFVEGTRSRTGALTPFKSGAFKLAIQTGTPIVPLVMQGTRDALPCGTWIFRHRVHGYLTLLPPIGAISCDVDTLKSRAFAAMQHTIGRRMATSDYSTAGLFAGRVVTK
jgi:1-acyl-sn-glycerol-3-phosphate acyltransferase